VLILSIDIQLRRARAGVAKDAEDGFGFGPNDFPSGLIRLQLVKAKSSNIQHPSNVRV
jgi:hypothetical protein